MTLRLRLLVTFCVCAVATAGVTLNVCASELPSVSGGDASVSGGDSMIFYDITPYSAYDVYYGSISSTYLEYMRGYLSKLAPDEHYVGARVGQYDYLFAYGADLQYNGSFSGACTVIRWNTYNNGSFTSGYDGSFSLNPGSYLVYSDLSEKYPSLATVSDFTLRQILILFTIFCLCITINTMYQVRKIRRIGSHKEVDT